MEIPPPMKPISSEAGGDVAESAARIKSSLDSGAADITEIERIVKEKMEQHEGKLKLDTLSSIDEVTTATEDVVGGGDDSAGDVGAESVESALRRRNYALKELISTEERYIEDLALIVEGYMPIVKNGTEIPIPDDLKGGKDKMVFANIAAIYEWHKE